MTDPVRELKTRAEILHGCIQRRQCLALVATELGFTGWPHARGVLSGERNVTDFGTLLYPKRCPGAESPGPGLAPAWF